MGIIGYVYRTFMNSLEIPWTVYDVNQDPHTLEPGESKKLAVNIILEGAESTISNPPVGMQRLVNFYRNPKTGRMEVEYLDVLEE